MAVPRRRIITFEEGAKADKDIEAKAPKEKKKERGEGEHMGADTGGDPVKGKTRSATDIIKKRKKGRKDTSQKLMPHFFTPGKGKGDTVKEVQEDPNKVSGEDI